jgi:hypothetical protein
VTVFVLLVVVSSVIASVHPKARFPGLDFQQHTKDRLSSSDLLADLLALRHPRRSASSRAVGGTGKGIHYSAQRVSVDPLPLRFAPAGGDTDPLNLSFTLPSESFRRFAGATVEHGRVNPIRRFDCSHAEGHR